MLENLSWNRLEITRLGNEIGRPHRKSISTRNYYYLQAKKYFYIRKTVSGYKCADDVGFGMQVFELSQVKNLNAINSLTGWEGVWERKKWTFDLTKVFRIKNPLNLPQNQQELWKRSRSLHLAATPSLILPVLVSCRSTFWGHLESFPNYWGTRSLNTLAESIVMKYSQAEKYLKRSPVWNATKIDYVAID